MRYKALGKTGIDLSVIGFGGAPLGNEFGGIDAAEGDRAVHLAIDGWPSPLTSSYLGVVIIWYEAGKIHRAILEFLRCIVLSMNTSIIDVDIF